MSKTLKLEYKGEVRKPGAAPNTINELVRITRELFFINNPVFEYRDSDQDTITFHTQMEYLEALKMPNDPIRFTVKELDYFLIDDMTKIPIEDGPYFIKEPKKSLLLDKIVGTDSYNNNHIAVQACEESDLIEQLTRILHPKLKDTGISCTNCSCGISGPVFVCYKCDKYFICSSCEEKDSHMHILIKAKSKKDLDMIKEFANKPEHNQEKDPHVRLIIRPKSSQILNSIEKLTNDENYKFEIKRKPNLNEESSESITKQEENSFSIKKKEINYEIIPASKTNKIEKINKSNSYIKKYIEESNETMSGNINHPKTWAPNLTDIETPNESSSARSYYEVYVKEFEKLGFTDHRKSIRALQVHNYNFDLALEHLCEDYLNKFKEMGFTNSKTCLEALAKCNYNFNLALEYLYSS